MCYQEIDGRAKKCPFCHHWQHRLMSIGYSPTIAILPIFLVIILIGIMLSRYFNQGEAFELHRSELTIQPTEMKFGETQCGPTVVILGTITNSGDRGWKDVNVEILFKDKDGKLIDGDQDRLYSMNIPPHGNAVLKTSMKREFPADQYKDYTITILSAKDSRAWP